MKGCINTAFAIVAVPFMAASSPCFAQDDPVDPVAGQLTLTADEALWRPGNRWIVEGNLATADGTPDVGGFVIAQLVKADGTRIEIGRATVDIAPVPGFDIANRPINPISLDNVDEATDVVEVFGISSDGSQTFMSVVQINGPPAPLPHEGTQVILEDVEILTGDRLIIHGMASVNGGPATGSVTMTTNQSNKTLIAQLEPVGGPAPAGGFDFVVRPITGNAGFINGETLTATHPEAGKATWTIDTTPQPVPVPAVTAPAVITALETAISNGTVVAALETE